MLTPERSRPSVFSVRASRPRLAAVAIVAALYAVMAAVAALRHDATSAAVVLLSGVGLAYVQARQRRARTHLAAVLAGQTEILERITRGAPLDAILTALVEMVERHADGMLCSVLVLDGDVLRYGAAPGLPAAYRDATNGIVIGPTVGSCGTAAYRRECVIVADIAQDPLWKDFRDVALSHDLRACWSAPILGSDRACLGTLAMYYHEPRPPDVDDLELIESAAHLAGVAIERHRNESALAASRHLLEEESRVAHALVQAGQAMLASRTTPAVLAQLARLTTELLGCDCADTVARLADDDGYVTRSADGYAEHEWESLQRLRMPSEMVEALLGLLATRPVLQIRTADVEETSGRTLLDAYGITTSLYVALRREDERIGFLSAAYRGRETRFSEQQQRIAMGLAQLASMALENARLVEEARRASQLKTEFVSTMSHELRTPLSVIIGYTDMLVDHSASAEQKAILAKIRTSSVELLEMIEMTLNVNRLEAGHDIPHFERLSLPAVFDQLAEEFAAVPRPGDVALRWEAVPVAIRSDRRKLRIVLKNLVGNALKFTPRGAIVIRCAVRDGICAVAVEDSGVGIAQDQLPVIFDMFRQGDSSDARSYGGIGLGLYIVRRLVTQLGGEVTVASERGRGSTFTITVPLAASEELRASA